MPVLRRSGGHDVPARHGVRAHGRGGGVPRAGPHPRPLRRVHDPPPRPPRPPDPPARAGPPRRLPRLQRPGAGVRAAGGRPRGRRHRGYGATRSLLTTRPGHETCALCRRWFGVAAQAPAQPRLSVQYAGGPWLGALQVGSVVTLTDPDLGAARTVALVTEVTPGPGECTVSLLLLDAEGPEA